LHRVANMEIAAISRPKPGEDLNGDAYCVEWCNDGNDEEKLLIAVVDGLGHGKNACIASETAVDFIKSHKQLALKEIVTGVHNALHGTRGAVIGICDIRRGKLSYIGVGNITAQIVKNEKQRQHLTSTSGVLGWNLRKVNEFKYDFLSGWLIINSDGIGRFASSEYLSDDLHASASKILSEHGKNDDATIVLGRYQPPHITE
jgi:serine phosphatase RsbU (regulator of sigma subunit)